MKLKAIFQRKDPEIETENCEVSKVIELPQQEFDHFLSHLLDEYDFLVENRDVMGFGQDGTRHCLLVLCEGGKDGVLVDAQGSSYARYSSFLPNARQQMNLGQYESLNDFASHMWKITEDVVAKAIAYEKDGMYRLQANDLPDPVFDLLFDYELLGEMLSERPEFDAVEKMSNEILLSVDPEYRLEKIDESKYRVLDADEVDIMLANHMLYLRGAGGEQANFSNCLLRNMELPHAVFTTAIIDNALFIECNLSEADMNFVSAHQAHFIHCDLTHFYGDEASFTSAVFDQCDIRCGLTMHANYTGASFSGCNVERLLLQNCCLADTAWNATDKSVTNRQGAVYSTDEWESEFHTENMKME